ncbi:tetratricopeptide repeat protein [Ottowia testudinis]|uniref:Tetratricopeptide repeat protein n=1 Tax=Ottowia testudinis TaxID=2816950 RepID=A0A975CIZ3_9BURK|nr:tetratricopeptide repeat protein [Ottowia testudinis]QTD46632.1 tetratricopeptide repeat protein [Ottowia testudinis]
MTARLMYELLVGELLFREGDAQKGTAYVLDAARRLGDESLFKRATEMAIQSRSGPTALEATRAWRQALPSSSEAGQYELQVLIVLGRIGETEEPARRLLATLPAADKVAFITALPTLYQRVPDKTEAARVVEGSLADALKNPSLAPAAWTSIGRMRLQAGDKAGALAAATLGQNASAQSEWPALLALQLMAANEPKAEALIKRHLARSDARPEVHIGYARALIEQGRQADAHAQLDTLIRRAPDRPESWLVRGALFADENKDAQAEADLQRYLKLLESTAPANAPDRSEGPDHARMMLARIAERRGDYGAAEQWLAAVDSPEQALSVQTRRAQMLARQGKLEEAREAIRRAPERTPDDKRLKLQAEAQMLRDNQQAAQAYQLLSDELEKSPDDDGLLYDAAMAAERANQLDTMERLLRRVIELKPDAAHAYNALGYSFADRGMRLDEARALIEKAVQLSPDDAYIQDSLAWVHFRLGNARQARKILENAYKKRPDAEIAAHLGEVLWTLGERDGARRVWREGLRLDARNEALVKALQRLGVTP